MKRFHQSGRPSVPDRSNCTLDRNPYIMSASQRSSINGRKRAKGTFRTPGEFRREQEVASQVEALLVGIDAPDVAVELPAETICDIKRDMWADRLQRKAAKIRAREAAAAIDRQAEALARLIA